MIFKNLKLFIIKDNTRFDTSKLNHTLKNDEIKKCGPQDLVSQGWVSPFNSNSDVFCLQSGYAQLFQLAIEEKVIPPASINKKVQDKINEIYNSTGIRVGRKQKNDIKNEILFNILPNALSKFNTMLAYIDNSLDLLVVDSSSQNKAEDLVSQLRQTLGSFKASVFSESSSRAVVLTNWLSTGELPEGFEFGHNVVLQTFDGSKSIIRCKNIDFNADEITRHIENGYMVTEIGLCFRDRVEFTITYEFSLKGIKLTDVVLDELEHEEVDSEEQLFDSKFTLISLELRELLNELRNILPIE